MSEAESPPSKPDEETEAKKALDRQKGKGYPNLHKLKVTPTFS